MADLLSATWVARPGVEFISKTPLTPVVLLGPFQTLLTTEQSNKQLAKRLTLASGRLAAEFWSIGKVAVERYAGRQQG